MSVWRVYSGASAPWAPNTVYAVGARVVCRTAFGTKARRKYVWECTTGGTSHATTEPTWPDGPVGQTVNDNTVVWTCRLPSDGNWLNASCYLPYVTQYAAATGDQIYVHKTHSESLSWAYQDNVITGVTDPTGPWCPILCVDKDNANALSYGAVCYNSNSSYPTSFQQYGYAYGITFKSPSLGWGGSTIPSGWIFEGPSNTPITLLEITANNGALLWAAGAGYHAYVKVLNGDIKHDNINYPWRTNATGAFATFIWRKGRLITTSGIPVLFSGAYSDSFRVLFEDIDLSDMGNYSSGGGAFLAYMDRILMAHDLEFRRCKFPSANFTPVSGFPQSHGNRFRAYHCSAGNRYYDFIERTFGGETTNENTVVKSGGASDGTTPQAWKITTSAQVKEVVLWYESPPIHLWGDYEVSKTFTIEGIYDGVANLQNDEVWMELEYPADGTSGLGAKATTKCAPLTAPTDLTASLSTWGGSLTNPNRFKFEITITPGKKAPVTARICVAKPSNIIYIDPKITVS